MKKRDIKNIIILFGIFVYLIIYKKIIITSYLEYENIISPTFMIITSFITVLLLGFKTTPNKLLEENCRNLLIYELIMFFVITYSSGIFIGFLKNSYSLKLINIVKHIISPLIVIITSELIRYIIIHSNKDKKYPIAIITILIIILELLTIINAYKTDSAVGIFRLLASSLIPLIIKHSLVSYISYNTSYKLPILVRVVLELYVYIVPIFPNFGESIQTIVNIILYTIIYITLNKVINERAYKEPDFKTKKYSVIDYVYLGLIAIIIGLCSGLFKYSIVAVGSDSMAPTFKKGDAVFINQKPTSDELKKEDIILFYKKDKLVIHRISRIENENGKNYYYTKGDANNTEDNVKLTYKDIKGKVIVVIPYVAYPNVMISEYRSNK